ncbi:hypothetical protein LTR50_006729 [Elasticomyces elasticus]|nr:hypothetical protein LTR50_006729 [Elasticomyces elasticus]
MAQNPYQSYGGNPYEQPTAGGYGASNPYGGESGGYGATGNPYGGQGYGQAQQPQTLQAPPLRHNQASNYSQQTQDSTYSDIVHQNAAQVQAQPSHAPVHGYAPPAGGSVLSQSDFLSRVEAIKGEIRTLSSQVSSIGAAHQRTLASTDASASAALESLVTDTQVLNTRIKDQIKFLELDAARSGNNTVKNTQIGQLKTSFEKQLREYQREEADYRQRYQEQIARQYRIVNPDATEEEVREASQADWGNEGVFQTALKTNRSATANTVLGAVRARHNDIQNIEKTLIELNQLFQDLAQAVVVQDAAVVQAEQHTETVKQDTEAGNKQLDQGIKSARRARKLKWWCLFIVVLICCILALALGLYFGLPPKKTKK